MTREPPDYMSFLLRLWRAHERGLSVWHRPVWRASLQNPHTGERVGFATLDDLFAFLRERTGLVPNVVGCLVVGEPRIDYEGGVIVAKTLSVILEARGGFVNRRASEEEHKQHEQVWEGIREKWKKDPGIRFMCYFLRPGVGPYFIFEVDDVSRVEEMDRDIWLARDLLVTDYSLEIVLGDPNAFENWRS